MSGCLHAQGKGAGNREVSRSAGRALGAAGEKGAHGGNRVSPVGGASAPTRVEATA
jgi:hypothetical protein